jgi:hypothetical protein
VQAVTAHLTPHTRCFQYPDGNEDNHYYIENGLNAALHGDVIVDQPQSEANYD